jgi:hypothetical protein
MLAFVLYSTDVPLNVIRISDLRLLVVCAR